MPNQPARRSGPQAPSFGCNLLPNRWQQFRAAAGPCGLPVRVSGETSVASQQSAPPSRRSQDPSGVGPSCFCQAPWCETFTTSGRPAPLWANGLARYTLPTPVRRPSPVGPARLREGKLAHDRRTHQLALRIPSQRSELRGSGRRRRRRSATRGRRARSTMSRYSGQARKPSAWSRVRASAALRGLGGPGAPPPTPSLSKRSFTQQSGAALGKRRVTKKLVRC